MQKSKNIKKINKTSNLRKTNKIPKKTLKFIIDFTLLVSIFILLVTGIIKFIHISFSLRTLNYLVGVISELHDWSGFVIGIVLFAHIAQHWKWYFSIFKNISHKFKSKRRAIISVINIILSITFILVFITGIVKIPRLEITQHMFYLHSLAIRLIHDISGIIFATMIMFHIVLHWRWIIATTSKLITNNKVKISLITTTGLVFFLILSLPIVINSLPVQPEEEGIIMEKFEPLDLNPENVKTIRPDIFKNRHYSIFDILVNLKNAGKLDLEYHFDESMNTHVIDSLNGSSNWWYYAYYDGGWPENNVFRMDHYPYKPGMNFFMYKKDAAEIDLIYETFRKEIIRLKANDNRIIIPVVIFKIPAGNFNLTNVEVYAHDLRSDVFQEGVITAMDVIQTLGDQGVIYYEINWYDTILDTEVKNYFVDGINGTYTEETCGFVYEEGDLDFRDTRGNHIHIPADMRVLNSPEYVKWFYVCI